MHRLILIIQTAFKSFRKNYKKCAFYQYECRQELSRSKKKLINTGMSEIYVLAVGYAERVKLIVLLFQAMSFGAFLF